MGQSSGLGNEQATGRSKQFKCGYLAGLVDGEGSLSITSHRTKDGLYMRPIVRLSNTDQSISGRFADWLRELDVPVYQSSSQPTKSHYKPQYHVTILGWKRVNAFLNVMLPYLEAKREQAVLLKQLIDSRLSRGGPYRNQYTDEELELRQRIVSKNKQQTFGRYVYRSLNDYTRSGRNLVATDGIVWTAAKAAEAAAMSARRSDEERLQK